MVAVKNIESDLNSMRKDLKDMDNVDTVEKPQLNDKSLCINLIIPEDGPNRNQQAI